MIEIDKYKVANYIAQTHDIECDACGKKKRGRCYNISIRDESKSIGMPSYTFSEFCKKCGKKHKLHSKDKEEVRIGISLLKMKGHM